MITSLFNIFSTESKYRAITQFLKNLVDCFIVEIETEVPFCHLPSDFDSSPPQNCSLIDIFYASKVFNSAIVIPYNVNIRLYK